WTVTTCTPLPVNALRLTGKLATSVLPSPVFISAILPWCRTTPPTSCTSKWRIPMVRRPALRHSAKASIRSSSRSWPSSASLRISSDRARRPASSSSFSSGSSSLMATATARWRLTSRSLGSRRRVRLTTAYLVQHAQAASWANFHRASPPPPRQRGGAPSGDDRLDDPDRAVRPHEGDLDHARVLVEEDVEVLPVRHQLLDRLVHRLGP